MRTYNQIIIAVKDGESVTEEELKTALLQANNMLFFAEKDVQHLIKMIDNENPNKLILDIIKDNTNNFRFNCRKQTPIEFLGGHYQDGKYKR